MKIDHLPFEAVDWSTVDPVEHRGETGVAVWRTRQFGAVRIRMVEYSAGYRADHWCAKGHFLLCLSGELHTELRDGRTIVLRPSMGYYVADDVQPHRSTSHTGATLYIVD